MTRKRKRKCTRPRDRITQASCLLITALLIVSAVSAGVGTGTASAEPAGMVSVPDQNITEDIPADASTPLGASQLHDGRILTDSHAMSLDVILTTPARAGEITGTDTASLTGDMALILRDTEHSAGRRVAIDSGLLQTALGYEPQAIYGTHENGEQWTAEATYVDGYLVFDVPHFSTNTVTFTGEIALTGVPTDGTQYQYTIRDSATVNDFTATITGQTNTEWDNVSKTGLTDGATLQTNVAGAVAPTGPVNGEPAVTFTGDKAVTPRSYDMVADTSGTGGTTVNGNLPPENEQISATVNPHHEAKTGVDAQSGRTFNFNQLQQVSRVWIRMKGYNNYNGDDQYVEVYVDGQSVGTFTGNGEYVFTFDPIQTNGHPQVSYYLKSSGSGFDGASMLSHRGDGVQIWNNQAGSGPPSSISMTANGDTTSKSVSVGDTVSFDREIPQNGSYSIQTNSGVAQVDVSYDDVMVTKNPSVSYGSNTVGYNGVLADGERVTKPLPGFDTTHDSVTINTAGGSTVTANVQFKERSRTVAPQLSVNGHTVGTSDTLADGESREFTIEKEWLQKSNTVSVSLDGAASSDAPALAYQLDYTHSATSKKEITYQTTIFDSAYNTSVTYADATASAKVTFPFKSSILGVKNLEYRVDGGAWERVSGSNYRIENKTTLDVYLAEQYGEPLPSGSTVDVRATARKLDIEHGEVSVIHPTKPGQKLNTQVQIDSRSDGFALNVGPTRNGERVHYAYSNDYQTKDYAVVRANGKQELHLPQSHVGDRITITHLQTKANVIAGDVKLRVMDPDEPRLDVSPGPMGSGDTVEMTYYGGESGRKYMLHSLTRDIILDSATAHSPVTFTDDDSDEKWEILRDSGGSGDTGGGGGLIGVASGAASSAGSAVSGLLPAISVPALGGIGGVGSAGFALILAGAVAVLVYGNVFGRIAGVIASLNPFGGTPASGGGADTGNGGIDTSGVTSALSGVVTRAGRVGGTAGVRVLRATTQLLTTSTRIIGRESARLARYLAANPSVALGLGGVGVAVAAYQGLVQLTPQATTAILIGSGGLVTYLVLQRTGTFSWLSFGLIFGAFVILGAGAINPDVLASFGASLQDILPLLVIVGAYVVYRILQTRSQDASTPDTIVRFTGGGSGSDDNNN